MCIGAYVDMPSIDYVATLHGDYLGYKTLEWLGNFTWILMVQAQSWYPEKLLPRGWLNILPECWQLWDPAYNGNENLDLNGLSYSLMEIQDSSQEERPFHNMKISSCGAVVFPPENLKLFTLIWRTIGMGLTLTLIPEDSSCNLSSTAKLEWYRNQWWNSPGPGLVTQVSESVGLCGVFFLVTKSTPETDTVEKLQKPHRWI